MEQPLTPKSPPSNSTSSSSSSSNNKKRPPTPEEVLAHYESQGLDSRAASLKAISDLQTLLLRSVASSSSSSARGKKDRLLTDKLDKANTRLAILEMKLDSKPSFPESIAIGITSGAVLRAIGSAAPHFARIWDSVNSATNTSHP